MVNQETEFLLGMILIFISSFLFLRRKHIWNNYKNNYKPKNMLLFDVLVRPYNFVYYANAFFVFPVFFFIGGYFIMESLGK